VYVPSGKPVKMYCPESPVIAVAVTVPVSWMHQFVRPVFVVPTFTVPSIVSPTVLCGAEAKHDGGATTGG